MLSADLTTQRITTSCCGGKVIINFQITRIESIPRFKRHSLNAEIPDARDFSKTLRTLNRHRQEADYELGIHFNLKRGQTILDLSRRAIVVFDAIDKTSLSEGIEDYLRKTNQI